MISWRRRMIGVLEMVIGVGLLVGFFPTSSLLGLNPSPFFILVIYSAWTAGTLIGVLSGLLASAVYLTLLLSLTPYPIELFWKYLIVDPTHYLTPLTLFLAGYLFGEMRMTWERRVSRLRDQADLSQQEAEGARQRLRQAETALLELQGRVLGQTATMSRLYAIARSLNVLSVDKILLELMGVLEDLLQVEQASLYRIEDDGRWGRLAVRKGEAVWPNSLEIARYEVFAQAIAKDSVMAFPKVGADEETPIYLVPVLRQGRTYALLVIRRLPLEKVTADTRQLLKVIAEWAGDSLERATAYEDAIREEATYPRSRVLRAPFFEQQCVIEHQRHERYGIPYSILQAQLEADADVSEEEFPELITQRLTGSIRAYDLVMWDGEQRTVAVLLPTLEPERAMNVAKRIWERIGGDGVRLKGARIVSNTCQAPKEV
ncbi:MAG TPA: GAF domain-containing protein [Bacilli bacterium]|nr:GAF domain-containing protein [Bacilli bacterium]